MAYIIIPKDKLKLVQRIAEGSFGTVYKAVWYTGDLSQEIEQTVAAKRVDNEEGERELNFLCDLEHPNIVKLLGMVDHEVDVNILLEFCDGGSLRDYLDEHRGTNLGQRFFDRAKHAGRPIAFLKTKGVVHKDVKSLNYLITNGNILKLCDFGLAKEMGATITNATERASYPWMAPELLKDGVLSPSYDIFAFGVVVWELWTTDPPFEGCEPVNLMYRICHNNERLPIPSGCPKQITNLMFQCWETDWKRRPSMKQALAMVESALQAAFVTGPWELESTFGQQDGPGKLKGAKGIAVCPNGDTAVLDWEKHRVCVYSNETTYKFHLDLRQGMNFGVKQWPWNVTVNADGIFFVTCNCYVLMYSAQGEYNGRWLARSPENTPSDTELYGLTIDNNGQLLVGQVYRPMYISKHRQDGSHIASIKVNIKPYYLAATSHDTIVISDHWRNTAQVVDSTGLVLHTLNANKQLSLWLPRAICCCNDILLVCNHKEISCFSVHAECLGSFPLLKSRPWGVAMTSNGRLLMAYKDMVLVYKNKSLTV